MKKRCVFFCGERSPYGLAHLEPLLNSALEVSGVVFATEKRWSHFRQQLLGNPSQKPLRPSPRLLLRRLKTKIRNFIHGSPPSVRQQLQNENIPVLEVWDVNAPEFLTELKKLSPDLIISAAYPQIFAKSLLTLPSLGAVNFHPSLLPQFRGAHPIFWAIAKGATQSGVTAHFMTEKLDAGDIISQRGFAIEQLNYDQLYARIIVETPALVHDVAQFFVDGQKKATPQKHHLATVFRNDRPIHYRIFWEKHTGKNIHDLIRTQRAFCFFRHGHLKLRRAARCEKNRHLTNDVMVEPGTIVDLTPQSVVVKALEGCLDIYEFRNRFGTFSAEKWQASYSPHIGEKFH